MNVQQSRPIVLVVEDDAIVRFDATQSFEDAGLDVIDAQDGDHAVSALSERADVDALFTDTHLPGSCNGLELARRAREQRPKIVLLITSGLVRPAEADLPANSRFVPKPYDAASVAQLIKRLVDGRREGR